MARYIALDLDQRQVRLLSVTTGRGGSRFEQAFSHTFTEDLTASSGEALGKVLREQLKQQGIASAPLLACVGRDRVILKEVRFPAVPQNEEAALVRFQASKELTESASEVVIDYLLLSERSEPGPRLAMAMVMRRDLIQALNVVARGMGLKLIGVVPRPIAMAAALDRAGAAVPGAAVAILNVSDRWAEFCVIRDGKPRFSRSLLTTATLMFEVKRSLMLYGAQEGEENLPQVLYLGGKPNADLLSTWRDAVGLKVQALDPFRPTDKVIPEAERDAYLSVAGLGHLAGSFPDWPVNFARPKESGPAKGEGKRKNAVLAAVGGGIFLILLLAGIVYVWNRRADVAALRADEQALDAKIKDFAQDKPTVDNLRDWDFGVVSWLDEFYDISAIFPHAEGVRINQLNASTLVRKGPEDKFSGRITLHGYVPNGKVMLMNEFVQTMMASPRGPESKTPGKKNEKSILVAEQSYKPAGDSAQEFHLKIDVAKQTPPDFRTVLVPPKIVSPRTIIMPVKKAEPEEEIEE